MNGDLTHRPLSGDRGGSAHPQHPDPPRSRTAAATGAALLAIVLGAGVTGCSEPAPVGTLPDAPTTAGSTGGAPAEGTPTATPPARPADEPTPESAIQFVRYFWQTYNYAYTTYDTEPLAAISAPTCTFCSSAVSGVKAAQMNTTITEGGDIVVVELTSPPGEIKSGTLVIGVLRQRSGKITSTDGTVKQIDTVPRIEATIGLAWNQSWSVRGVKYEVPGT